MNHDPNDTSVPSPLYEKYVKTARTAELAGGAVFLVSLLLYRSTGSNTHSFLLFFIIIGLALLLFGAGSLRPHNQVKAFAFQLAQSPDRGFAEGLLDALTRNGTISVTGRSRNAVLSAILSYGADASSDPELVRLLDAAAAKHLKVSLF